MGKGIHSFVGGELSFMKLGSILVDFSGGVLNFLESQQSQNDPIRPNDSEICGSRLSYLNFLIEPFIIQHMDWLLLRGLSRDNAGHIDCCELADCLHKLIMEPEYLSGLET